MPTHPPIPSWLSPHKCILTLMSVPIYGTPQPSWFILSSRPLDLRLLYLCIVLRVWYCEGRLYYMSDHQFSNNPNLVYQPSHSYRDLTSLDRWYLGEIYEWMKGSCPGLSVIVSFTWESWKEKLVFCFRKRDKLQRCRLCCIRVSPSFFLTVRCSAKKINKSLVGPFRVLWSIQDFNHQLPPSKALRNQFSQIQFPTSSTFRNNLLYIVHCSAQCGWSWVKFKRELAAIDLLLSLQSLLLPQGEWWPEPESGHTGGTHWHWQGDSPHRGAGKEILHIEEQVRRFST